MFNGSLATFEAIKRCSSVRVIAIQNNKIILNKEKQPGSKEVLGTFGGQINKNETPLQCAKRELLEESGLESKDWELLYKKEQYPEKMDFIVYVYVARNCKKIKKPKLDPGEKIKNIEVSFNEFVRIMLDKNSHHVVKELVMDILRMKVEGKLKKLKNKLFTQKNSH